MGNLASSRARDPRRLHHASSGGPGHAFSVPPRCGPAPARPRPYTPGMERVAYDEFGLFHENAEEFGLPYDGAPVVRRESVDLGDGRHLSALVWGTAPPELVLLHGGSQNAHTWDTVALALGRPLLAVDLPGHGHSDGGPEGSVSAGSNGRDLATVVAELAPDARGVVGMSLGGMSSIALAAHAPEL